MRWWFGLVLWGGFLIRVVAGGLVFAFVAYALLAVLGWA